MHSSSIIRFGRGVRGVVSGQSFLGASNGWAVRLLQQSLRYLLSLPNASGYPYTNAYGYQYNNAYGYSSDYNNPFWIVTAPIAAVTAPLTAPLMTGRSVATGQMGRMCSTPAKSCELYHASWVGNGCSCRVSGGMARGSVTP